MKQAWKRVVVLIGYTSDESITGRERSGGTSESWVDTLWKSFPQREGKCRDVNEILDNTPKSLSLFTLLSMLGYLYVVIHLLFN